LVWYLGGDGALFLHPQPDLRTTSTGEVETPYLAPTNSWASPRFLSHPRFLAITILSWKRLADPRVPGYLGRQEFPLSHRYWQLINHSMPSEW